MFQIGDLYRTDLTKKATSASTSIHILHQKRDQITGLEQKKSFIRKKKRAMISRINTNMRNREIIKLAQTFLRKSDPVKYGENAAKSPTA